METIDLFVGAWKTFALRLPHGTFEQGGNVASCLANVPLPFLNASFPDRPLGSAAETEAAVALAVRRNAACAHPSIVVVCDEVAPGWEAAAAAHGLVPVMNLTGMETDELLPPRRPAPPELEIRPVHSPHVASDLMDVNAQGYGMPVEMFDGLATMHLFPTDSPAFVGYVDGRPVCGTASLPVNDTVYIALVATSPDVQGRGYAEAVMRRAIEAGRQITGLTRVTLHASDAGRPLYASMGFQASAKFTVLAPPH